MMETSSASCTASGIPSYYRLLSNGNWHQVFLPELVPELVFALAHCGGRNSSELKNDKENTRYTFYSCCLVCHDWNRLFTPLLYERIFLYNDEKALLLCHTLWKLQPAHRNLVEDICILFDKISSHSSWTIVLTKLPNLKHVHIIHLDIVYIHPRFSLITKLLLKHCQVSVSVTDIRPDFKSLRRFVQSTKLVTTRGELNLTNSEKRG
ncbi:hypothetical protein QCA50_015518 [Cerrena zonata]|uniref:F-box domain-containing protein n=1 Tax=Cerrena zonata TaxID=2478898 RepID=A0AAW0FLD4_9APHY